MKANSSYLVGNLDRETSQGRIETGATPFLETQLRQFASLTESFLPKVNSLKEKGHSVSLEGVFFLTFQCSPLRLDQSASAQHRLRQPGVANHTWEREGKMQPSQPGVTPSVDSFCAALKKLWEGLKEIPEESL